MVFKALTNGGVSLNLSRLSLAATSDAPTYKPADVKVIFAVKLPAVAHSNCELAFLYTKRAFLSVPRVLKSIHPPPVLDPAKYINA